ncbi:MAG: FAD-dependent oxidoreductase [Candidatus Eisenbacteria bacterium]|nr:FAD-dependent oxidoreductase [Candidatus Eisenbacteria bacterium]
MATITLKVNGREVQARPGQTILELVEEQQLDSIPTLCHSPELEPYASCFLCVVEMKGRPNLVPACATRVANGMEIETRSERVIASRKTALELLLSNHYADCLSPCMLGCPAGVDAQGYIALAAMGAHAQAVDLIREANPLPAVCGRVCVRKCELVCRRAQIDAPVGINAVKRFLTDLPETYEGTPAREPDRGKSVGIVGAGPAGLTAAWFLGRRGYRPVVYEAMPRPGGMLRYGIPAYRLPDEVLDREVEYIARAGAEIRCRVEIGRDLSLDDLRARHDAIFLAIGAWVGKGMRVPGERETAGVVQGIEFLREKAERPDPVAGTVVVVGGGNTAMDCARTAWRCGAEKVILLYRRTKAEMPADEMEIRDCLEEGVEIIELAAPIGIVAEKGRLKALRCIRMKLGEADDSGRRRPVPMEGSEFDFPCDLAIAAIGQEPRVKGLTALGGSDIAMHPWRTFEVDTETMATNLPGVFAGGDAADDGPTVVIDAIRDGQRAARAIDAFLSGEALAKGPFIVTKDFWGKPGKAELADIAESPRHEVHVREVEERAGSFREVATGFEPEDTLHEAARCLSCGCLRFGDCRLRLYAQEYGVDLAHFAGYARRHKPDDRHPHIVYDPNKCILCGRCIRTCERVLPISALGLVHRGFKTEMRPAMNDPLAETSCVACGNCIDACPTGALTPKYPFAGRAHLACEETKSHCAVCSLACPITVRRFADGRYSIAASGVPGEYLCRFGRFGHERFVIPKRLTRAALRSGGATAEIGFEAACARAVEGLRAVAAKHGPESVAVFASPELSNEELYLAARIAREGLGTNQVGSLVILERGGESGALDRQLGVTASTSGREALRDADLIVCNNTAVETDHLILAIEILRAVRRGAKLVVANSILDKADRLLAAVTMDPMRGRATHLWQAVLGQGLARNPEWAAVAESLPGGKELRAGLPLDLATVSAETGVDAACMARVAELIAGARKAVFVHGADRHEDRAAGDIQTLANFVVLLRAAGREAELLLPRLSGNVAGLEVAGVDPAFLPGRLPVAQADRATAAAQNRAAGARSQAEMRALLEQSRLRAALIIGEDPLEHPRTAAYFKNLEFLVAVEWRPTETTRSADIAIPGSTYLESEGTRCNFEGRKLEYARAVAPPSGKTGWQVLAEMAACLGILARPASASELTAEIERAVRAAQGPLASYYWNCGEARPPLPAGALVLAPLETRPPHFPPAVTQTGRYKRKLRSVGAEHFRVR